MQQNKELLKAQKATWKRYPNAKAARDAAGRWYIYWNEQDIFEELFLPHTNTELDAWKHGSLTAKTVQNFNRTHPDKVDTKLAEEKTSRISRRKLKSKTISDATHIF